jgi:hypothetical protein
MRAWLLQCGIMIGCGLLFGVILRGVASGGPHAPYRGFSLKTVAQITILMTLGATFLPVEGSATWWAFTPGHGLLRGLSFGVGFWCSGGRWT